MPADADAGAVHESLPPNVSRMVLNAQEDLRREIARSMHDGPAQSLTNIVLQAQIVARLVDRDPRRHRGAAPLISMVHQTLDATKNFIFDVRPMVLDDLGLVPTLRRAPVTAAARAHVQVGLRLAWARTGGSPWTWRRPPSGSSTWHCGLPAPAPGSVMLTLDWDRRARGRSWWPSARPTRPSHPGPLPDIPTGDVPDAIRQMIQERHDAWQAAIDAAEAAAIVVLPDATARDVVARAGRSARRSSCSAEVVSSGW